MKNLLLDDTIAAISTPVGKSGIGIVRLSGKRALRIADKIFLNSRGRRPSQLPSHSIYYGWIVEKSKIKSQESKLSKTISQNGGVIDEVLLSVMRAPRTYTREDIVEINCHSGIVVLRKILELVLRCGARLAEPGEFTRRAYLSGRIDLAQAEAVLDIVNSQTKEALEQGLGQLQGKLSKKVKALRQELLDVLTQLELAIDFSDQEMKTMSAQELLLKLRRVGRTLEQLLASAERGAILRQGISCVICGRPNVGKSSLLNALLKKERAIVTALPGTTRDVLEETLDLGGIPLRLIDTAGMSQGKNLIEREALRRSRKHIKEANLLLLVLDSSRRLSEEDLKIASQIKHRPALIVLNKQDLPGKIDPQKVTKMLPQNQILGISALRGQGLAELEKASAEFIWQGKSAACAEIMITNLRHKEALQQAQQFLRRAVRALKQTHPPEIAALELKAAQRHLSEIIGEICSDDILERVFSQFCIGK